MAATGREIYDLLERFDGIKNVQIPKDSGKSNYISRQKLPTSLSATDKYPEITQKYRINVGAKAVHCWQHLIPGNLVTNTKAKV